MAVKEASVTTYEYPNVGVVEKVISARGGHSYRLNGSKVPSPTDVLQPNAMAMSWYGYALGLSAGIQLSRNGIDLRDLDLDQTKLAAKDAKLTPNHDNEAKEIGSWIHNALELYAEGNALPTEAPENCRAALNAVSQYIADEQPHILRSEVVVASAKYGYAGTLDAIVGTKVQDYKTSKAIYPTNHIQVAAYVHAAQECGIEVDSGELIHLDKNTGQYSVHPCVATIEDWACALDHYNRNKLLEQRMKNG